ncbi:MAG: hypothetical protein A2Y62_04785 [Candidatus Fischerbacteria bacterium RBG_13_37_8]|uniref:Uncharacterized protein n=1 Tax=Candidatus Fischerbacteria bacterium RBG_13_37_8 TaxID=1817863 RepID=A0A1F5VHQ4_9BACT|nr:MAG: hypothetical protein A2Y62_04785 [Candidatus Fischerbacteria bacterium RBG_13_37_8]
MNRKCFIILIFILIPLILISQQQDTITDEEYNVYSDLLPKLTHWPGHSNENEVPPSYIVIEKTSAWDKGDLGTAAFPLDITDMKRFEEKIGIEITQDIIDDFNQKIKNSYIMEQRFRTLIPVILISEENLKKLFATSVCNFYNIYPNS